MQPCRILFLVSIFLIGGSNSICLAERWVGVKVLPLDFAAPIRDGDRTIGELTDFDWPRTVEKVDGDRVWLSDTKLKGWVEKRAVESVDDFLKRRTEEIHDNPNCWSYTWRGVAWNSKGKHDLAIKDYSRAIRLAENEKDRGYGYRNRGESRLLAGDPQTAIHDLTEGIRLLEEVPTHRYEAYRLRALAHEKLGDKEAAEADRREADRIKKSLSSAAIGEAN